MTTTSQPEWTDIANLGDVHPIDHGGCFIKVDATGVYQPEAELLESPAEIDSNWDDETGDYSDAARWTVYRFILEPCTYVNGILSDSPHHPDHPVWFADDVDRICSTMDVARDELIRQFTSDDPLDRATAWRAVGDYHGFNNLDGYPLELNHAAVLERYPQYA